MGIIGQVAGNTGGGRALARIGRCLPGILLLVYLLASASVVRAGVNVWTSHGPYGGSVYALASDPTTPNTLYADRDLWGRI